MRRGSKGFVLVALLAAIAVCVWRLALGNETDWTPFLSESAARFVFRFLTMTMGLGAWFVSQSLIGARGLREGAIGDAVHEWTAPLNGWLAGSLGAANALLITSALFIDLFGNDLAASRLLRFREEFSQTCMRGRYRQITRKRDQRETTQST